MTIRFEHEELRLKGSWQVQIESLNVTCDMIIGIISTPATVMSRGLIQPLWRVYQLTAYGGRAAAAFRYLQECWRIMQASHCLRDVPGGGETERFAERIKP